MVGTYMMCLEQSTTLEEKDNIQQNSFIIRSQDLLFLTARPIHIHSAPLRKYQYCILSRIKSMVTHNLQSILLPSSRVFLV